jgi:hypothetical protein
MRRVDGATVTRLTLDAQIPRLRGDVGSHSAPPGGAGSRQTAEHETTGSAVSRARPPPRRHRQGPQPRHTRLGGRLSVSGGQGELRGHGKWLRRKLRCIVMATVEAPTTPPSRASSARSRREAGACLRLQRPWAVVERGRESPARGRAHREAAALGSLEFVSAPHACFVNRRMPTGTSGGVGGED